MMRCALAALLVPYVAIEDGEKPTLFWMHVPKTGSFFAQTIRRVACPSYYQALRNGSAPPGPEPELRDWPKTCDWNLGAGSSTHTPYDPRRREKGTAVTLLRSPTSRLVSAWYFDPRAAGVDACTRAARGRS